MINPDPTQQGPTPPDDDPLRELRERLARTQEAAERLAEAATGARRRPPPAGWQTPPEGASGPGSSELRAVATLAEALRGLVPPDLQEQIGALVRELLLAVRALIDYLVDRLERRRSAPVEVEDIPIG
jgi:hypothetical protein